MDSSSPALRLCCPARCAVCRRHTCRGVGRPVAGLAYQGCGDTQGLDSFSPAPRLCCPARCGVCCGGDARGFCSSLFRLLPRSPACICGSRSHTFPSQGPAEAIRNVLWACAAARCQPTLKSWRSSAVAEDLRDVQCGPAQELQKCRGESGWCSDMTSNHGVWRHTGVGFLLSGAAVVLPSVVCRLPPPCMLRRRRPVAGLAY